MKLKTLFVVLWIAAAAACSERPAPSHEAAAPSRPPAYEVARVNGVPLMSDRLTAAVNTLVPLESFHRNVKPEKMVELQRKALQTIVDEELQYEDGVRLGVTVTDAEVDDALARGKKQYATEQAFEDARRETDLSMSDLRREIRRALIIQKADVRQVTSQCEVDQAEAARFFAANPQRFVMPEQLHVYAMTIGVDPSAAPRVWTEAKARAADVRRQIKGGARFEDMARKYSTDPSRDKGGDMGFFHRGTLNDAFEQATRDLKPGQVSDVVQTLYGYHVVRVSEIRPPQAKTFAEVGAQIQKDLTTKRCADMRDAWLARLRAQATVVMADTKSGVEVPAPGPPAQRR